MGRKTKKYRKKSLGRTVRQKTSFYKKSHMNMMRHMNTMMNSFFGDPFGMHMGFNDFDRGGRGGGMQNSLMPAFPMPMMPNMNRLLGGSLDSLGHHGHHMMGGGAGGGGHSYSSSTVVSMSSGPDGRPQVYKATSSTRTAPGGIKETQKSVQDSRTGTKRMAIGHHIGERAHIVEKEHNLHTGDQEEREDFINLEEEEAEDFNREWEHKASRMRSDVPRIASIPSLTGRHGNNRHSYGGHSSGGGGANGGSGLLAITAGPSSRRRQRQAAASSTRASPPLVSPRRTIRSSPMSTSSSRTPYAPPSSGQAQPARKNKNIKTVSGSPPSPAANNTTENTTNNNNNNNNNTTPTPDN